MRLGGWLCVVGSCAKIGVLHGSNRRCEKSRRWISAILKDITTVTVADGYRLRLRFEDGVEGEVDVSQLVSFDGVFADLRDPAKFRQVRVDSEIGTIVWPNGADLDPDVLYARITGRTIPMAR